MDRFSDARGRLRPRVLRQAERVLRAGGVLAYPTEAVYGLGCDPLNPDAVMEVLRIKQRSPHQGLILVSDDFARLRPFVVAPDPGVQAKLDESWPGPVTWLLPAAPACPWWIRGASDRVAVRVSAHPATAALCRQCGIPLVSTSANRSGLPPARSPLAVRRQCPEVDLIVHAPLGGLRRPTPIRDAVSGEVLRD